MRWGFWIEVFYLRFILLVLGVVGVGGLGAFVVIDWMIEGKCLDGHDKNGRRWGEDWWFGLSHCYSEPHWTNRLGLLDIKSNKLNEPNFKKSVLPAIEDIAL